MGRSRWMIQPVISASTNVGKNSKRRDHRTSWLLPFPPTPQGTILAPRCFCYSLNLGFRVRSISENNKTSLAGLGLVCFWWWFLRSVPWKITLFFTTIWENRFFGTFSENQGRANPSLEKQTSLFRNMLFFCWRRCSQLGIHVFLPQFRLVKYLSVSQNWGPKTFQVVFSMVK